MLTVNPEKRSRHSTASERLPPVDACKSAEGHCKQPTIYQYLKRYSAAKKLEEIIDQSQHSQHPCPDDVGVIQLLKLTLKGIQNEGFELLRVLRSSADAHSVLCKGPSGQECGLHLGFPGHHKREPAHITKNFGMFLG